MPLGNRFASVPQPSYEEVEEYTKEGLPEDHFFWDYSNEDSSGTCYIDSLNLEKIKGEVPQEILYSARFMDGLSADSEVYSLNEFLKAFAGPFNFDTNGIWWHQKFVHHARIVFDFLNPPESPVQSCSATEHVVKQGGKTTSGHLMVECEDVRKSFVFYCFVMDNIEGLQSQTLMRDKLFSVLSFELRKLPKTTSGSKTPERLIEIMHALQVVAMVFATYADPWLTFKFYGEEDLDYCTEEVYPRVQSALSVLERHHCFNSKTGCEMLVSTLVNLEQVEWEYSTLEEYIDTPRRKYLFRKLLDKWTKKADVIYRRFNDTEGLLPLELKETER